MKDAVIESIAEAAAEAAKQARRKALESRRRPGAEELRRLAVRYLDEYKFSPGDLVRWKPGMKNARFPDYGEPVVVLDVEPGRVNPSTDFSTNRFREPNDLRIGTYPDDESFEGYWLDAKRFEPYRESAPAPDIVTVQACPSTVGEPGNGEKVNTPEDNDKPF